MYIHEFSMWRTVPDGKFDVIIEPGRVIKKVHIPTIGIGASAECDGQVLVYQDMLAMYGNFVPKFVKQFAQVGEVMQGAVKDYINAVKEGTFPGLENTYAISDDVIEKLY